MSDEARAGRRLERERRARQEAEEIAERVTRELYQTVGELQAAKDELEAANRAVREFVAIASHDLRSPLASILGFAQLLETRWHSLDDDKKLEFLRLIMAQGGRLERLTDDLLTLSKIEAEAMEAHVRELSVRAEIDRTLQELGDLAGGVHVDVPDDLTMVADPDHVSRVMTNYVANAAKYGKPPVVVCAAADDSFVEIRVVDCGDGVPPEFVNRLFGKFARADTQATREQNGTGLGLSIVRGLAQLNGGDAWYEPNDPSGSCFAVRFPAPTC